MSEHDPSRDNAADAALPIGAVTHLTGVSTHTLRKWESRYNAIEPIRTETGRRMYTQAHVRKLIKLRDLTRQGHQISQLAAMSNEELEALATDQPGPPPELAFERATVVGQVLSSLLGKALAGRDVTLRAQSGKEWLAEPQSPEHREGSALVIELPTLSKQTLQTLLKLRQTSFAKVVVVYGFATRKNVARLLDGGILCLKAPVTTMEVLQNLSLKDERISVLALLDHKAVPSHRFSQETIARVATLAPNLQCECPNHIAQLLLDIGAFEQYSLECEDTDPAERALHARLRLIAANARTLFEEALIDVAKNEGIKLDS